MMESVIRFGLAIPSRLIVLNVAWASLVVWAWFMGYVGFIFTHDISRLSYVISGVLLIAIAAAFAGHNRILPHARTWVVLLGLIGNLAGFVVALQGMAGGDMHSADGLMKIGMGLIDGLGVAFCSTLVGAVSALWMGTIAYTLKMEASE